MSGTRVGVSAHDVDAWLMGVESKIYCEQMTTGNAK